MPKYCHVYKTMCTDSGCDHKDCAFSAKTRVEAEIARGVRLTRGGRVIEEGEAEPSVRKEDAPRSEKSREEVRRPAVKTPTDPYLEDESDNRRSDAVVVGLVSLGLAALVGGAGLIYYLTVDSAEEETEVPVSEVVQMVPQTAERNRLEPAPTPAATPEPTPQSRVTPTPAGTKRTTISGPRNTPAPRNNRGITDFEMAALKVQISEGNNLRQAGDMLAAREMYRKVVEQNPEFFEGYNNLANTYTDLGNHEEAIPYYLQGLAVDPQSTHLQFNIGNTYLRQKNYPEALRRMRMVIELDPMDAEAHLLAGVASYELQSYVVAARYFQDYIEMEPEDARGYYNLALTYFALGEPERAEPFREYALRLDPDVARRREPAQTASLRNS